MSSLYATRLTDALPDDVPAPVAAAARESLGAAVQAGGALRPDVADVAPEAFIHAMSRASIVVAVVAALGTVSAWRHLPARGIDDQDEAQVSGGTDDVLATVSS